MGSAASKCGIARKLDGDTADVALAEVLGAAWRSQRSRELDALGGLDRPALARGNSMTAKLAYLEQHLQRQQEELNKIVAPAAGKAADDVMVYTSVPGLPYVLLTDIRAAARLEKASKQQQQQTAGNTAASSSALEPKWNSPTPEELIMRRHQQNMLVKRLSFPLPFPGSSTSPRATSPGRASSARARLETRYRHPGNSNQSNTEAIVPTTPVIAAWRLRVHAARRRTFLIVMTVLRLQCGHRRTQRLRRVDSFSWCIQLSLGSESARFVDALQAWQQADAALTATRAEFLASNLELASLRPLTPSTPSISQRPTSAALQRRPLTGGSLRASTSKPMLPSATSFDGSRELASGSKQGGISRASMGTAPILLLDATLLQDSSGITRPMTPAMSATGTPAQRSAGLKPRPASAHGQLVAAPRPATSLTDVSATMGVEPGTPASAASVQLPLLGGAAGLKGPRFATTEDTHCTAAAAASSTEMAAFPTAAVIVTATARSPHEHSTGTDKSPQEHVAGTAKSSQQAPSTGTAALHGGVPRPPRAGSRKRLTSPGPAEPESTAAAAGPAAAVRTVGTAGAAGTGTLLSEPGTVQGTAGILLGGGPTPQPSLSPTRRPRTPAGPRSSFAPTGCGASPGSPGASSQGAGGNMLRHSLDSMSLTTKSARRAAARMELAQCMEEQLAQMARCVGMMAMIKNRVNGSWAEACTWRPEPTPLVGPHELDAFMAGEEFPIYKADLIRRLRQGQVVYYFNAEDALQGNPNSSSQQSSSATPFTSRISPSAAQAYSTPLWCSDPWHLLASLRPGSIPLGAHMEGISLGARALAQLTAAVEALAGPQAVSKLHVVVQVPSGYRAAVVNELEAYHLFGLSASRVYLVEAPAHPPCYTWDPHTRTFTHAPPRNITTPASSCGGGSVMSVSSSGGGSSAHSPLNASAHSLSMVSAHSLSMASTQKPVIAAHERMSSHAKALDSRCTMPLDTDSALRASHNGSARGRCNSVRGSHAGAPAGSSSASHAGARVSLGAAYGFMQCAWPGEAIQLVLHAPVSAAQGVKGEVRPASASAARMYGSGGVQQISIDGGFASAYAHPYSSNKAVGDQQTEEKSFKLRQQVLEVSVWEALQEQHVEWLISLRSRDLALLGRDRGPLDLASLAYAMHMRDKQQVNMAVVAVQASQVQARQADSVLLVQRLRTGTAAARSSSKGSSATPTKAVTPRGSATATAAALNSHADSRMPGVSRSGRRLVELRCCELGGGSQMAELQKRWRAGSPTTTSSEVLLCPNNTGAEAPAGDKATATDASPSTGAQVAAGPGTAYTAEAHTVVAAAGQGASGPPSPSIPVAVGLHRYVFHLPSLVTALMQPSTFRPKLQLFGTDLHVTYEISDLSAHPNMTCIAIAPPLRAGHSSSTNSNTMNVSSSSNCSSLMREERSAAVLGGSELACSVQASGSNNSSGSSSGASVVQLPLITCAGDLDELVPLLTKQDTQPWMRRWACMGGRARIVMGSLPACIDPSASTTTTHSLQKAMSSGLVSNSSTSGTEMWSGAAAQAIPSQAALDAQLGYELASDGGSSVGTSCSGIASQSVSLQPSSSLRSNTTMSSRNTSFNTRSHSLRLETMAALELEPTDMAEMLGVTEPITTAGAWLKGSSGSSSQGLLPTSAVTAGPAETRRSGRAALAQHIVVFLVHNSLAQTATSLAAVLARPGLDHVHLVTIVSSIDHQAEGAALLAGHEAKLRSQSVSCSSHVEVKGCSRGLLDCMDQVVESTGAGLVVMGSKALTSGAGGISPSSTATAAAGGYSAAAASMPQPGSATCIGPQVIGSVTLSAIKRLSVPVAVVTAHSRNLAVSMQRPCMTAVALVEAHSRPMLHYLSSRCMDPLRGDRLLLVQQLLTSCTTLQQAAHQRRLMESFVDVASSHHLAPSDRLVLVGDRCSTLAEVVLSESVQLVGVQLPRAAGRMLPPHVMQLLSRSHAAVLVCKDASVPVP